jgi:DNA invertase Pin-like site-specific DNA recombinase
VIIPKFGRTTRPANRLFVEADPKNERAGQIEAMLKRGVKPTDIAEALGIARSTLSQVMGRRGLKKP